MSEKKNSVRIYLIFMLLIAGTGFAVFLLNQVIINREIEKRDSQLANINSAAISRVESSLKQFATVTSGLRSFLEQNPEMPLAPDFQRFTNNLLRDLDFQSDYVISFIDTTHTFVYVFERNRIDPNHLSGNPIPQVQDSLALERLNALLTHRNLKLSGPVNLLEGWLGISFSFSVHKNGKPIGYITPSFSLKKVLNDIYDEKITEDFVFKFMVGEHEFDRRAIYNGSPIYNNEVDSLYHENFNIQEKDFIYSELEIFSQTIRIGTAHKEQVSYFNLITFAIMIGFFLFIMAFWYISQQTIKLEGLNAELTQAQKVVTSQKIDLEKQNEELSQLNTTKDRFFSIIGHDIKSPLASVSTLIDLKSNDKLPEMSDKEVFERVKISIHKTLSLLESLLHWSILNSNKVEPEFTMVDLSDCIQESVSMIKQTADDKDLQIDLQLTSGLQVVGDKNMISSSIRNVLSNAIKFTPNGGNIQLNASKQDEKIRITIKDSGIGIDDEDMARIFELDKNQMSGTNGEIGSGLGLVLTKEFIDKNGGEIVVESELGKGSTFTIVLPANGNQAT